MGKRYLGYGITNANGVATLEYDADGTAISHSYTGVGSGEIDIIAESGELQSDTVSIYDCLFADRGNNSNHNTGYSNSSNYFTVSYTSDYTELSEANPPTNGTYYYGTFPMDYRVEADVYIVDGITSNSLIRFVNPYSSSNISSLSLAQLGIELEEWSHIQFDVTSNGIIVYRSDGTTYNRNLPTGTSGSCRVGFWSHGDITTIRFKNVMVYPI